MSRDAKGRAWYDKIYRKFETILVEVDSLASQGKVSLESSDSSGFESTKDEPEKLTEDHCSGVVDIELRNNEHALQRCKSPSDLPLYRKFGNSQNVRLEEHREGDSLKEKLSDSVLIDEKMLPSSSDCSQTVLTPLCRESQPTHRSPQSFMTAITCNIADTLVSPSGISTGDSDLIPFATEIQAAPAQDKVSNTRSFSSNYMHVNQDEFFIEDFDLGPLDTIDLYDMTFREDPSDFDDNLLYAARDRTKQLRSFKRKIMDALTSKRRREKEYEQLAIWFGDADMGCDLASTKEHATTSLDSKSSQSIVPFVSEDSEWELL